MPRGKAKLSPEMYSESGEFPDTCITATTSKDQCADHVKNVSSVISAKVAAMMRDMGSSYSTREVERKNRLCMHSFKGEIAMLMTDR